MSGSTENSGGYHLAAKRGDTAALAGLNINYFANRELPSNMAEAERIVRSAAKNGDPEAQASLAGFYMFGLGGLEHDEEKAAEWWQKAALQGHADAQYNLGRAYGGGVLGGVTPDYFKAVMWLRMAVGQGYVKAQYELGRQLLRGKGTVKDKEEAVTLLRPLAEGGSAGAQIMLGQCYANGEGVVKNTDEARIWFKKAEEQ
jgi:TPR repeat protein